MKQEAPRYQAMKQLDKFQKRFVSFKCMSCQIFRDDIHKHTSQMSHNSFIN